MPIVYCYESIFNYIFDENCRFLGKNKHDLTNMYLFMV